MLLRHLLFSISLIILFTACGSAPKKLAKSKKALPKGATFLFIGDSLTAGYGVDPEDCFVGLFDKKFQESGWDLQAVNAGISGETSAGTLARIDWLLESNPTYVFLNIGSNDGFRGLPAKAYEKNLETLIQKITAKNIPLILAGIQIPLNLGISYADTMHSIPIILAKRHNLPCYPFLLEGVALQTDLNLADGIHPNEKGHQILFTKLDTFFTQIGLYEQIKQNSQKREP